MESPKQSPVRLKLLIAYDGRPYCGWQRQTNGESVQACVERALARIAGAPVVVHGAGRTDAGVHATGQVAHADVPASRLSAGQWQAALNANLPAEIRILRAARGPADFHARFSAKGKLYVYRLWNDSFLHPLEIERAWHVPRRLDMDRMREAAGALEGTHDFSGFSAAPTGGAAPQSDRVRTVFSIRLRRRGRLVALHFHGSGFLYKMVRMLAGSIVRCGEGRGDSEWIASVLTSGGERKTQFAAPAAGLYLAKVFY